MIFEIKEYEINQVFTFLACFYFIVYLKLILKSKAL